MISPIVIVDPFGRFMTNTVVILSQMVVHPWIIHTATVMVTAQNMVIPIVHTKNIKRRIMVVMIMIITM